MRKIINLFKRVPFEDYDKFDNSPATVKESQGDDLSQIADKELVVNNNNELLIRRKEKVFKVGGGVGKQGKDGKDGVAKNGLDGVNAYVYIAYASDDEGADFTMTFDPDLDYIAILGVDEEIETPEASDFDGLWKDYKGQPIDHVSFTSTTALSGLPNEPGEIDTYTVWGDVGETINLGTFDVYNGNDGIDGTDGTNGTNGVGVPIGGTTGQALVKKTNADYDTEWATLGAVLGLTEVSFFNLELLSDITPLSNLSVIVSLSTV